MEHVFRYNNTTRFCVIKSGGTLVLSSNQEMYFTTREQAEKRAKELAAENVNRGLVFYVAQLHTSFWIEGTVVLHESEYSNVR